MPDLPDILDDKARIKLTAILGALRLPERIRIMEMVAASRQAVSTRQLGEALGISASNVSHHLKELANLGLVTRKRVHGTVMVESDGEALWMTAVVLIRICRAGGWIPDRKSGDAEQQTEATPARTRKRQ